MLRCDCVGLFFSILLTVYVYGSDGVYVYGSDGPGVDSGGLGGGSGGPGRFETLISYEGFSSKGPRGVYNVLVRTVFS